MKNMVKDVLISVGIIIGICIMGMLFGIGLILTYTDYATCGAIAIITSFIGAAIFSYFLLKTTYKKSG